MRRLIGRVLAMMVLSAAVLLTAAVVTGQGRQGGRGAAPAAQPARPEDNRPPVFFREDWNHQFDRGGAPEGPVGQQHVANVELQKMIVTIEAANGEAREALASLGGTFTQTATMAHATRLISADMRDRTETLQRECERIVAMLRQPVRMAA